MSGEKVQLPVETPLTSASQLLSGVLSNLEPGKPIDEVQIRHLKLVSSILSGLDSYLDTVSSDAPNIQEPLLRATFENDWDGAYERKETMYHLGAHWSAGAYEGNLVGLLTKLTGAKKALEIGMFTGTTTVCIASQLPTGGSVTALEIDPYLDTFTRPLFEQTGLGDKIKVKIGDARDQLAKLAENIVSPDDDAFDIIFIDADKTGYQSYFETILDKNLLKKNGLLVVDNTLYKGSPWNKALLDEGLLGIEKSNAEAIREFNVAVKKDARVEVVVLPVRDGVSLIMRK
ncbi:hypothetical protein BCV70DRAFT_197624 [Testicularia cyperi]|uniref:S-adenosyl-L-methionine-dependent methyltransferase n=1 Tax=Testicularia cyperi TaxID=1882483 RepID=A0A317Y032_9BASI|nr:hypothetical protein BCV70DRAFT_197624 [Testicularia cyperi]